MKIKRYVAASMREALASIRAEQGDEAVILSSRRTDGGIEVVSAVDYDAALIGEARRPDPPATAQPADLEPARPPAEPRDLAQYEEMKREIRDMRRLLESELTAIADKHRPAREPFDTRVLDGLATLDIAPDVARALARRLPRRTNARNPAHIPLALLVKFLPVRADSMSAEAGVVAVVGPTGVGKTTTIAKLAARWCLQHGNQDLALVSTDGYRIGARDQLLTYARILGAPMHVAEQTCELTHVLERLKSKRLVLIDTAGLGQRDPRIDAQLDSLACGAHRARVLLAVSAAAEPKALDEVFRVYARVRPAACVLTKIDEAASLGGALSAVLRHQLPLSFLCDGQRVPEDLHCAAAKRVWLVRTAMNLRERSASAAGARVAATQFGRVQEHA